MLLTRLGGRQEWYTAWKNTASSIPRFSFGILWGTSLAWSNLQKIGRLEKPKVIKYFSDTAHCEI